MSDLPQASVSGDGRNTDVDADAMQTLTPPSFILRTKRGRFVYLRVAPDPHSDFSWYIKHPRPVTISQLELEMAAAGRRWFATDKTSYDMLLASGACRGTRRECENCSTTEGDPHISEVSYACLRVAEYDSPRHYWVGERVVPAVKSQRYIIVTIAELYLKNPTHQRRMIQHLMANVRRVLNNKEVGACGNALIAVSGRMPSAEELNVLSLVPGIGKVYHALPPPPKEGKIMNGYDPRGEVLLDGAGGMPILREQSALCLISGGMDSPVAAYRMMTRGCHVNGVHFLNSTNETAAVMDKNKLIAAQLSKIQGHFVMRYVDIQAIQTQIVAKVPNHNRTLVYKWFMLALGSCLGNSLPQESKGKLLIVGDSLGQVASQTIDNIATLYKGIGHSVIAPLIGMHKTEIMETAKRIGTFHLSAIAAADCCQFMMCKVGANLWIGERALRGCVRAVQLEGVKLPVIAQHFFNGELIKVTDEFLNPTLPANFLRPTVRAGHPAASMKCTGPETQSNDDDSGNDEEEDPATKTVHFDAAAGTMVHHNVQRAMRHAPQANPSGLHAGGRAARMAIENARVKFATFLGVAAGDIIFTSGGTESNNIALHGYKVVSREAWMHASTAGEPTEEDTRPTIAVIDLVNHETGSVNWCLKRPSGVSRLHVDACQALMKVDFVKRIDWSEVDSMSFTAHKINGPVGCGVLYVKHLQAALKSGAIRPLVYGGSQEGTLRPGTENTPSIVGFAEALLLDRSQSVHRDIEELVVSTLADLGLVVNARGETSGFICHATLPEGFHHVDVVAMMSAVYNVEIGTGAACKTGHVNHTVYTTLQITPPPENRSLRFSWDHFTSVSEAVRVMDALQATLKELKRR